MLTLGSLVWIGLLVAGAAYWWRARGFKSQALSLAWRHCQQNGVQLLDQSVVMKGIRVQRGSHGRLQLQRCYDFEFSSIGDRRYHGTIVLAGVQLASIQMEPYTIPDTPEALH